MGFLQDLLFGTVSSEQVAPCNYRAEIVSDRYAYIENVKGIKSFDDDKVELFLKKGTITVTGKKLFLKKYGTGDVCIGGEIEGFFINKNG